MIIVEIILLFIAYTMIIVTIFLEIICYKRNLETMETIAFTVSLLLLIIALSLSPFIYQDVELNHPNIFILLSMILVSLTTPLNSMAERIHNLSAYWKKLIYGISGILFIGTILGYFTGSLNLVQYPIVAFLIISVIGSMIFVTNTKPQKRMLHREKIDRKFALAFCIILPISLFANYILPERGFPLQVGFVLPLIFILLSGSKLLDDLERLSLYKIKTKPNQQHFINFGLTNREQEIATLLSQGKSYKDISGDLHISMPTVKTHASNIYKKCGVKSRSELSVLLLS